MAGRRLAYPWLRAWTKPQWRQNWYGSCTWK